VVYDLDGDGKAEVVMKAALYAATPEEAFISDNGFVLEGPEYCSVLDGMTGKETAKVVLSKNDKNNCRQREFVIDVRHCCV
jgi:hypothetical protein